ncbi:MAG TPA: spore coat protein U domain-containing protein [Nevskiaceae bacterium]
MKHAALLALLVLAGLAWHAPAHAQLTPIRCTETVMSSMVFGTIRPQSSQADSTATLTYRCYNTAGTTRSATVCFNIGQRQGSYMPRQMALAGSTSVLDYQLYQDPAHSMIWGNQFAAAAPTPLVVNMTLGPSVQGSQPSVTGTATVYGRVLGGQTTAAPGAYTDPHSAADTSITINDVPGGVPPGVCAAHVDSAKFGLQVSARVVANCSVSAAALNFGPIGSLDKAVDGSTQLRVQCDNTTPYQIGLDAGRNGGGDVDARRMVRAGAGSVRYQLYQNPGRSLVWGDTLNVDTQKNFGNGQIQTFTVYGQVPAQPTPPAGAYTDNVTVTLTF